MVHYGKGEIGTAQLAALGFEPGKSLGRRGFVNEVAINVDNGRLASFLVDNVRVPDFW